jgi:hypothetical protein
MTDKKYYFFLMNQKQMLEDEVLEEILRERTSYYVSKNRQIDFWLLISPNFISVFNLDEKIRATNFYKQQKENIGFSFTNSYAKEYAKEVEEITKEKTNNFYKDFYSAIVSSDKEFIKWLKLRLGYFENIDEPNILSEDYVSDGVSGILPYDETKEKITNISLLTSNKNFLHPEILLKKYKKALEISYTNPNL